MTSNFVVAGVKLPHLEFIWPVVGGVVALLVLERAVRFRRSPLSYLLVMIGLAAMANCISAYKSGEVGPIANAAFDLFLCLVVLAFGEFSSSVHISGRE